jgi:hypothetical protein
MSLTYIHTSQHITRLQMCLATDAHQVHTHTSVSDSVARQYPQTDRQCKVGCHKCIRQQYVNNSRACSQVLVASNVPPRTGL